MHFNSILPEDFPYVQASVRKPEMKKIISEVIERYNKAELRIFLDSMKSVGFKYGAKAGLTVAMNDVKTPPEKLKILEDFEEQADKVQKSFEAGALTEEEKKQLTIQIWNKATDEVEKAMSKALESEPFNPVDMMVKSGARGNMMQVRQLAGMRGHVANPKATLLKGLLKVISEKACQCLNTSFLLMVLEKALQILL